MAAKKKIEFELSGWQSKVWLDTHRFKVINCGRRAGKSTLSAIKILQFASDNPGTQVWYLAPTYKQAKQIMWAMLRDLVPKVVIKSRNEVELRIELVNKSVILLKGVDDPDSLRGTRIDLAIFDEVAFMTDWETIWKVMRPTLVDSMADVWFISTPNGMNHFYDLFHTKDERYQKFHFTSYDNPKLTKEELDDIRKEMTEDAFAQEFLAEFRKMSGLIYRDFKREVHMVNIPYYIDDNWTFVRALDFGFSHKTALIYVAISPTGKEIYVYDGLYLEGLTIPDIAEVIRTKDGDRTISWAVADSAQPAMIAELNKLGIRFRPVEKGRDSVKNGIQKVAELLKVRNDTGKPTIMFNKSLEWIAKEFEAYRWMEGRGDGVLKEVPYKFMDDACFTRDTKILTTKGNKRIDKVKKGDYVITPFGKSKVLNAGITGEKQVNNYGMFKSTPNHKILTQRGIIRVDGLRYNDLIWQKQSTLKEFLTEGIQNQKKEHIEYIFNALLTRSLEAKLASYTGKFGKILMEKFLRAWTFIIKTGILQIMTLAILNVLLVPNTLKNITGDIMKDTKSILIKFAHLLKYGIPPKKEKNGTLNMAKNLGRIRKSTKNYAQFARKNTKHTFLKEASSVIKIAKPQPLGLDTVYNLSTEHGMYYANGILVSNCDAIRYFVMSYKVDRKEANPNSKWLDCVVEEW